MSSESLLPPPPAKFEEALDQTLHWTLSLYIDADRLYGKDKPLGVTHRSDPIRRAQLDDPVSRALRDAIEPLFNDIADREWLGNVQDFLLAADANKRADGEAAAAAARKSQDLTIHLPDAIRWETEGSGFVASPARLGRPRKLRLRRFWFAHNDGALSYHLAFTVRYDHTPTDYYYLSLLQKLCAPKEFNLAPHLQDLIKQPDPVGSSALGIAPLDEIRLVEGEDGEPLRFWEFVANSFSADASRLLQRLAQGYSLKHCDVDPLSLIEMVPLLEVPGLRMPKCRTLFFFHDKRFFDRLMPPVNAQTGSRYPRKAMVRDECYAPYAEKMKTQIAASNGGDVLLDDGSDESYWHWVRERPDQPFYASATDEQIAGLRNGTFVKDGKTLHIPAFESKRSDCLDYLFLSGFNQNIIDFMNQDTSEILDSIDPIFPRTDEQKEEGFFVRFANHRSMITYAQYSRSLEVGNDYIGTCPYAFLIHVLSLHNEFLARGYERKTAQGIEDIQDAMSKSNPAPQDYRDIELRINNLKIARYRDFERHRHVNVFRYDTERDVFEEMEQLRGTNRKQHALSLALASLEDHARDIEVRQHQEESARRKERDRKRQEAGERSAARERQINQVLTVVGLLAMVSFLKDASEFLASTQTSEFFESMARFSWWHEVPFLIHLVGVLLGTGVTLVAAAMLVRYACRRTRSSKGQLPADHESDEAPRQGSNHD